MNNDFRNLYTFLGKVFLRDISILYLASAFFPLFSSIEINAIEEKNIQTNLLHKKILYSRISDNLANTEDLEVKYEEAKIITEKASLLSTLTEQDDDENPFISYTQRYVIENQPTEENLLAYRIRTGIKILTILYGSTGGVPYINSCCNAGQGILFLCVSFAVGNVISSGGSTIWAGLRTLEAFDPISKEEKRFLYHKSSCNTLKHLVCNSLGLISCIPGTYSVYKYNNEKFLVIPGFLNNYFFSTVGYYEITNPSSLLQQVLSKFRKRNVMVKSADNFREKLLKQINDNVIPYITVDSNFSDYLFSSNLKNIKDEDEFKDFIKRIYSIKYSPNIIEPPETWQGGYPKKFIRSISLLLPLSGALVNYLLNYEVASLLITSPALRSVFAISATLPSFMIDSLSADVTTSNLFDAAYNRIRKRNKASFLSSNFPKINLIIPIISVALACLSVTGGWVVSKDAVQNSKLNYLTYPLSTMTYIAEVISQSYQMRDLFHDVMMCYYCTFDKDNLGETARRISRLEKFSSAISNCDASILYRSLDYKFR